MPKKTEVVLVCVAHRDDESLGCAGAIQDHIKKKNTVFCISMTDGISSRSNNVSMKQKNKRVQNSLIASKILGFKWIDIKKKFPDNKMDQVPLIEIVRVIEEVKKK